MTGIASPERSRSLTRGRPAGATGRDVQRTLAPSELFFSTTDTKGIITAGNRVFERISGYRLDELVGRAHNIVRHPDMPRAVFQLLWDELAAGRAMVAYVKNRTADGEHYWVLATVVPITTGYLSVRLAPGSKYHALAQSVYQDLVASERSTEGGDVSRRKPAIAASVARLGDHLTAAGYRDYRVFMQAALIAELGHRNASLPQGHRHALAACSKVPPAVAEILGSYSLMSDFFARLVAELTHYGQVGRALAEHAAFLRAMGEEIQLFALNAQIGASRLGEQGAALDAVARLLTEQSNATSPLVSTVAQRAGAAVASQPASARLFVSPSVLRRSGGQLRTP